MHCERRPYRDGERVSLRGGIQLEPRGGVRHNTEHDHTQNVYFDIKGNLHRENPPFISCLICKIISYIS